MALTVKQQRFAYLVATGLSKTASYAQAYNSHGNANTQGKNGCVLSKQPAIAAAIAEYEAQLLPLADARAEKLTALRSIKMLALSPNVADTTRLKACVTLYELCERVEAQEGPKGQPFDLDDLVAAILQELRRAGEEAKGLMPEETYRASPLPARPSKTKS